MNRKDKIFIGKIRKTFNDLVLNQNLINNGDRVICALSGGKDSMAMLDLLAHRKKYFQPDFNLIAVYVHVENAAYNIDKTAIENFCKNIDVPFIYHNIFLNDLRNGENRCFICSTARRSALFTLARQHNCNKIALGHNMDDVVETFMMNTIFHGKNETFTPKTALFNSEITLIRPIIEISKVETLKYSEIYNFPKIKSSCGYETVSMRAKMRQMLNYLQKINSAASKNIFNAAMKNVKC